MAWLTGWQYRKSCTIQGSSAGAVTDYQIKIVVHYGSGTDSGEHVYLNGKCRSDFGDIRFTASDGETLLDYFLESKVNGDYAVFWVKIPSIPAYPDTTIIYIYYGKSDATYSGVAEDVMFAIVGSVSDTGQYRAIMYGYYHLYPDWKLPTYDVISRWLKVRIPSNYTANIKFVTYVGSPPTVTIVNQSNNTGRIGGGVHRFNWSIKGSAGGYFGLYTVWDDRYHYIVTSTVGAYYYYYGRTDPKPDGTTITMSRSGDRYREQIQGCFRKYIDPEPSITAWGSEETPAVAYEKTLEESTTISEAFLRVASLTRSFEESTSLSDIFSSMLEWKRSFSETITLSDVIETIKRKWIFLSETIVLSDVIQRVATFARLFSETISLSDVIIKIVSIPTPLIKVLRYVRDYIDKFRTFDHNDHVDNWKSEIEFLRRYVEFNEEISQKVTELEEIINRMRYIHHLDVYMPIHHNTFVDAWKKLLEIDKAIASELDKVSELEDVVNRMKYLSYYDIYYAEYHNLFRDAWKIQKEINKYISKVTSS